MDFQFYLIKYSDESKTLRGNRLGCKKKKRGNRLGSKILEGFVKSRKIN